MNDNCPVGCFHCMLDKDEEHDKMMEAKQRREEDDANFADQDDGPNYNLAED